MRFKLTVEYDGTNYFGWQLQAENDTIQARLESALQRIFGEQLRVSAAGRTDAGVHALGQVAAFDAPRPFPPTDLKRALNALLPRDIVVKEAAEAVASFDPRRDARSRIYEYRILNQSTASAFDYRYSWQIADALDLGAMQKAAQAFEGEHDFAGFRTLGTAVRTTVRCVSSSAWRRDGNRLIYRVEANSFLRHMVRTMVSTMALVGCGKLAPIDVLRLLNDRRREDVPAAAPASGLFLVEVHY